MHPRRVVPILLLVAAVGLAACSDTSADGTTAAVAAVAGADTRTGAVVPVEGVVLIDVRTPEEFDAGHVVGARLIDVSDPSFGAEIATLDPDASYVVYCRTGNRSAVATALMRAAGLEATDGGGLDDMRAAGWPFTG